MKNAPAVSLLAFGISFLAATTASANPPTVARTTVDTLVVDESCGFPVTIHTEGDIIDITWVLANGVTRRIEIGPQLRLTLSNLATGNTITVVVSGPGQFTFSPDGSLNLVGTGTWSWPFSPDTLEPGLFITAGRFVLSVDTGGVLSVVRTGGHMVDLCERLAE